MELRRTKKFDVQAIAQICRSLIADIGLSRRVSPTPDSVGQKTDRHELDAVVVSRELLELLFPTPSTPPSPVSRDGAIVSQATPQDEALASISPALKTKPGNLSGSGSNAGAPPSNSHKELDSLSEFLRSRGKSHLIRPEEKRTSPKPRAIHSGINQTPPTAEETKKLLEQICWKSSVIIVDSCDLHPSENFASNLVKSMTLSYLTTHPQSTCLAIFSCEVILSPNPATMIETAPS